MDISIFIKLFIFIFFMILNIIFSRFIYKKKKKFLIIPLVFNVFLFIIFIVGSYVKSSKTTIKIFNFYRKTNKGYLTKNYELIVQTKDLYNKSSIWRPKERIVNGILYKPLGDVDNFDIKNKPKKSAMLVPVNKTTKPIDYKLVFKNDIQKIYAWTPIPETGYYSMGDIITNTIDKPSLDLIRCVPIDWVREIKYKSDVSPYNTETGSIWVGSYENSNFANLIKVSNTSKNSLSPIYEFK